jgi:hypothetical protein
LPALYIADGHHRSAAALRVAQARGQKDGYFLAVLLPQQQMTILDYNRVLIARPPNWPHRQLVVQILRMVPAVAGRCGALAPFSGKRDYWLHHW